MAMRMICPFCNTDCWDYYCQECGEYFFEFEHDECHVCGAGGELECICSE